MRVLMTADTVGGVWTYAMDLAAGLKPRGVKLWLATMGSPLRDDQRRALDTAGFEDVFESSYRLEWMSDPWEDVQATGEWLQDLAAGIRPDLIHLNCFAPGGLQWPFPVLVVGHSCVLSWWEAVKGEAPPSEWDRYRQVVTEGLRGADAVAAPTSAMLDELQRIYGIPRTSSVVWNGHAVEAEPAAKEPLVFSAGRLWDEAKNVGAVEKVAPHLGWPVRIAGETRHPDLPGEGRTGEMFLGHISHEEVLRYQERASIFVFPARYEPFGLAALEAGQAGCALVVGDIPSLREVWGDAAVFVPPDDLEALLEALQMLIHDDRLRETFARRAFDRANVFSVERMGLSYEQLYRRMLEEAPAA